MDYLAVCEQLDLELTLEQHIACAFLEGRGLRFLVDFGYVNAVERTLALLELVPITVVASSGLSRGLQIDCPA